MSAPTNARESDLVRFYDAEAERRAARVLDRRRVERRAAFLDLLRAEGRRSVVEVGCGPGRDGVAMAGPDLTWTGVDLAPGVVATARRRGLDAVVASARALPFADASFDAAWSMSTLMHLATTDLRVALGEITRVLRPGAPLAIGLWGSHREREEVWHDGDAAAPGRFFSIRSDDTVRSMLSTVATVEDLRTWADDGDLHYQWFLARTTPTGTVTDP